MGAWKTVYEDEVEGLLVTVKMYQSTADDDGDDGPAVRVQTTLGDDYPGVLEVEDGDTLLLEREDTGRRITLEPCSLNDLEGELMEVGFSPEAAAVVASKIPA